MSEIDGTDGFILRDGTPLADHLQPQAEREPAERELETCEHGYIRLTCTTCNPNGEETSR